MWVKQCHKYTTIFLSNVGNLPCHVYHPWLGMETIPPIYLRRWLGDGLWHCFTHIIGLWDISWDDNSISNGISHGIMMGWNQCTGYGIVLPTLLFHYYYYSWYYIILYHIILHHIILNNITYRIVSYIISYAILHQKQYHITYYIICYIIYCIIP